MRIISGSKRGMHLLSPKGRLSRPITDRVKESLFSVLYKYNLPQGKVVADLFCGVGSLGLEALSRGADFVTFVEKDPKIIAVLNKNIFKAGFVKNSKVIRANAFSVGAPVDFEAPLNDLVVIDPPYELTQNVQNDSKLAGLMTVLSEQTSPEAFIVVRTDKRTELLERYGRFEIIERRLWGSMVVTILRKSELEN